MLIAVTMLSLQVEFGFGLGACSSEGWSKGCCGLDGGGLRAPCAQFLFMVTRSFEIFGIAAIDVLVKVQVKVLKSLTFGFDFDMHSNMRHVKVKVKVKLFKTLTLTLTSPCEGDSMVKSSKWTTFPCALLLARM